MVDFEGLRKQWYQSKPVIFEIIKRLMYKEAVFLRDGCVHRCIKANAVHYLQQNFERYHFDSEPFNLYGSLGHFPNLPMFSFNRNIKREEMTEFNKHYLKFMKGYDFMLDIDNLDLELAYKTAHNVKKDFDKMKIPYWLLFSGNKGFHIRVDYQDFPKNLKQMKYENLVALFKRVAENYKIINLHEDIDLQVFDTRRIAKTPYSVVYPNYLIAMPLSDSQFNDFSLKEMSLPYNIHRTKGMYNRGVLKRDGKKENFGKFIKKYSKI